MKVFFSLYFISSVVFKDNSQDTYKEMELQSPFFFSRWCFDPELRSQENGVLSLFSELELLGVKGPSRQNSKQGASFS